MNELNLPLKSSHLRECFKKSIDDFCQQLSSIGQPIIGYRNGDVHGFNKLDVNAQEKAISQLQTYISIYREALQDKIRPENEAQLLWYALKKWNYRPTADLFDKIESDDFIEVYNIDNIQIHRSFNYFRLSSYSLEDIFIYPWYALYDRDTVFTDQISEVVKNIFEEKITHTVFSNLRNHILSEANSTERRTYKAAHNYFSPLKDENNRQTAFVVLSKAELIKKENNATHIPHIDQ